MFKICLLANSGRELWNHKFIDPPQLTYNKYFSEGVDAVKAKADSEEYVLKNFLQKTDESGHFVFVLFWANDVLVGACLCKGLWI